MHCTINTADPKCQGMKMNQPLSNCLPVQRTQCTRKLNGPHSGDSRPWTTSHCHRLLRPIICRIELLKKDPTRDINACDSASAQTCVIQRTALSVTSTKDNKASKGNDACCVKGRKRVRRTYSARCKLQDDRGGTEAVQGTLATINKKSQERKVSMQPGEYSVPTPILNRSRSLIVSDAPSTPSKTKTARCPQSLHVTKDEEAHFKLSEAMREISKTTNAARYKLYRGIYNSLEALFKATLPRDGEAELSINNEDCKRENGSSRGSNVQCSKSLLSMCLRSIPNHIKEEEKRAAIEAEEMGHKSKLDTHSISTETYSDLESFGTAEMGWKHLKTVVRIHGVHIISDAIQEGLLDTHFASALVMLCIYASVPSDAEILLTSLVTASGYPNPKSTQSHPRDDPILLPLLTLEKFVNYTKRACYHHRLFTKLTTSGLLSVTWLGTKYFNSLWTSVFRSLSKDPSNRDATAFLTNILPLLYKAQLSEIGKEEEPPHNQGPISSVINNTLASVLTTLSAISMLSDNHKRGISHMLRVAIIDCQLISSELEGEGAALVAIANLLAGVEADEDADFVRWLVKCLGKRCHPLSKLPSFKDRIPLFVCSVARCCGRGSSSDGFEHLKIILQRLITLTALEYPVGGYVLQRIIVDSAFVFHDYLPNKKHMQYAQRMEAQAYVSFIQPKSSRRINSEPGFRWEEGINEWVMATPPMKSEGAQMIGLLSDGDSDYESPIRLGQKRRKRGLTPYARCKGKARSYQYSRVSDLTPASPKECSDGVYPPTWKGYYTNDEALLNHTSLRGPSSLVQLSSNERPVSKLPRLGYEPLCSRQDWKLFEPEDDESNPNTATDYDSAKYILLDRPYSVKLGRNKQQKTINILDRSLAINGGCVQEQSEDELGLEI